MDELLFDLNKLIIDPKFEETIKELNEIEVSLPEFTNNIVFDNNDSFFTNNGQLVTPEKEIDKIKLNPKNTFQFLNDFSILGYDESIFNFNSLEGSAYFTSHSLILLGKEDYIPINYLTFYFYTRSKQIKEKSKYIKFSNDPIMSSKKDYIKDKISFLEQATPKQSLLLIDGPLIGGDVYTYMIRAIEKFSNRNIIPIFFVKNSSSNMVTDNIAEIRSKFNSDMHWSYNYLNEGECTNCFKYIDKVNPDNAKIFLYMKPFNISPQRIEMHVQTYLKYKNLLPNILDTIYYLILVQGKIKNPQVRLIAIAEIFARSILKMVNVDKLIKEVGITPTINQTRFGW